MTCENEGSYQSKLVKKINKKIGGAENTRSDNIILTLDRCQAVCLVAILNDFILRYPENLVGNVVKELDSVKVNEVHNGAGSK